MEITKNELNCTLYYAEYGACLHSGNLKILYIWMSQLNVAFVWKIKQF